MTSSPLEAIAPDPRDEGSVRLVTGGRTLLSVPVEAARAEGLRVGMVIGPDQLNRLTAAADRAAAYRTALGLLGRRPYARRDLGRRLVLKGHLPDHVAAALDQAERAGYLDDARFAVGYVETRSARGRGPARLRQELLAMGVAGESVERALSAEAATGPAMVARIEALIAKRRRSLAGLPAADAKRRMIAYLARRGFRGADVVRLVRDRLS